MLENASAHQIYYQDIVVVAFLDKRDLSVVLKLVRVREGRPDHQRKGLMVNSYLPKRILPYRRMDSSKSARDM